MQTPVYAVQFTNVHMCTRGALHAHVHKIMQKKMCELNAPCMSERLDAYRQLCLQSGHSQKELS